MKTQITTSTDVALPEIKKHNLSKILCLIVDVAIRFLSELF